MKTSKSERNISLLLTGMFLLGLVPVLWLGRYNYPCADDFGFSAYSHIAWQETHSVFQVLRGAWDTVVERWFGWQGTFSSIFVMALQPALWGEGGYCLVPWIMIGAMSLSTLFLLYVILRKRIGTSRPVFLSISMIYLLFALECMIDKTQGFFWFNGAAHYMIPHSAALVLAGLLILLTGSSSRRIPLIFLSCLTAFFVGGSNYVTGLTAAVLFVTAILLLFLNGKHREARLLAPSLLFFFLAFLLNVMAPGNAVRQGEMLNRPGVVKSILLSFYYCVEYIADTWFDWTWLIFILALIPFLWEAAKAAGSRFSFRFPMLVLLYSYCLLSAMFTPSLYATGEVGGGRIFNIIFLDFMLLVILNLFYLCGWLYRHMQRSVASKGSCLENKDVKAYLFTLLCLTFFIGALYTGVNPDYFTSTSAACSLLSGEAASYGEEANARTQALRASGKADITLDCFSAQPYLLFYSDISEDPLDWKNMSMARYYQLNSITGKIQQTS